MSFRESLEAWDHPMTLYEVIPPPRSAPREEIADSASFIAHLLADHPVDAINIPEIRNEGRNGNRVAAFMKKLDPRHFAMTIRDVFGPGMEVIVNRPVVYEPPADQENWFELTFNKFEIDNLVIVGGESSDLDYPGPSVSEATQLARSVAQRSNRDVSLGAITIPARRRERFDEPERMLAKQANGVSFFTSQVIYEPDASRALLRDYDAACKNANVDPVPIFLSFAPITGRKDAQFLEWLGVQIPDHVREWVLSAHANALDRSVRVAEHVLRDVLGYCDRRELSVPVGVNVEHVMRYNFEASEVLLDRLASLLDWQELRRSHA